MGIDIATLAMKIDATEIGTGIQALDKLTVAGGKAEASTNKLSAAAKDLGKNGLQALSGHAGAAGSALGALGVVGLAAAEALGAVGIALQLTRKALAFGDEIADTANKLAVSTKALQEYRYAVHTLGGEYHDADAALQGFTSAFGAAHAGFSKRAAKPFEALGLDAKSFETTEEALQAVIQKISNLSSTAEQAAIADKLGISAMLPALRAGAGAIDDARAAAERLGFVMDDALIQKASAANDRLEDLGQVVSVQLNSAMVDLAPLILAVAEALAAAARDAAYFFEKLNQLNTWAANHDVTAIFGWANAAGAKVGEVTHLNRIGQAIQGRTATAPPTPQFDLSGQFGRADLLSGFNQKTGHLLNMVDEEEAAKAAAKAAEAARKAAAARQKALEKIAASEQAINTAVIAELEAHIALTHNTEALAALHIEQVHNETKKANDTLAEQLSQNKITGAAASLATTLNNRAEAEKIALIDRQTEDKIQAEAITQRQTVAGYYDQIASISASMAGSAAEQNKIEDSALAARQRVETAVLKSAQAEEVRWQAGSDSARSEVAAALADRQAAERTQQVRQARIRVEAEENQAAEASLESQISVLRSQAGIADSATARVGLNQSILVLEHQLERLKLEEIIFSTQATMAEKAIAIERLNALEKTQKNDLAAAAGTLQSNFDAASSALSGMASAFKSKNWGAALQGLDQTIASIKNAFGVGGTPGGKIGAVAGIAQAAGQVVGGKVGGALGGAAGGAMAGFEVGGPIGAAVGAVVGGVLGFLGASKADKQAKADAAAAEADRQKQIAQQASDLNVNILTLEGKATEALAAQRASELSQIDASNQALAARLYELKDARDAENMQVRLLQAQGKSTEALVITRRQEMDATIDALKPTLALIYAQEDLNRANEAATAIANEHRTYEIRMLEATGDAAGALAAKRADEVAGLNEANRAYALSVFAAEDLAAAQTAMAAATKDAADKARQFALDLYTQATARVDEARSALSEAYGRESSAIQGRITDLNGLIKTLQDFKATLNGGTSAAQSYASSRAAFDRAAANDNAAIPGAGAAFLAISKASSRTQLEFARDQSAVRRATEAALETASHQVSIEQQSLDALDKSVAGLGIINNSVLSVAQAINNLAGAMATRETAAKGAIDPQWGVVQNVDVNKALASSTGYSGAFGSGGFQSFITGASADQQASARLVLQAYGESNRIQGFAAGGDHMGGLRLVGEKGPELEATGPARIWNAGQTRQMLGGGDNAALEAKLDAVIAALMAIKGDTGSTAKDTGKVESILQNVTEGGRAMQTQVAA